MRTPLLIVILLSVVACAGPAAKDKAGNTIVTRERIDTTQPTTPLKAVTDEHGQCRHVYEQVGVHAFQRMVDGVPQVELCVINRCIRCGKVIHECDRYR